MNRSDLIKVVHDANQHLRKKDIHKVVEDVFFHIKQAFIKGEKVAIKGFGSFSVVKCKARYRRNIRTGGAIWVEAHRRVKFSSGKRFKKQLGTTETA